MKKFEKVAALVGLLLGCGGLAMATYTPVFTVDFTSPIGDMEGAGLLFLGVCALIFGLRLVAQIAKGRAPR